MRPVGAEFLRILRGSHRMISRCRIVNGFQTGVNPTTLGEIPIRDGDIQFDANADIRANLDLTTDPAEWPVDIDSLLTPYGTELFVERGIIVGGGVPVWVSQGYYRVESVEQPDAPRGEVRVAAKDRMMGLVDARLVGPVQFPTNGTVADVMNTLVLDVYPDAVIEYDFTATARTFPGQHIAEEDRFEFINDMITAIGKVWYWDHRGVLVVKSPPNPSSPVWTVNHGENGVLVKMSRERSRDGAYNAVVVTGEQVGTDSPPVRAVVYDSNPKSPTYWDGPFGKKPKFFSSTFLTTNEQCVITATNMLTTSIGLPYSVTFAAITNPALEVRDPILLTYADDARSELHVLDKITMPLTANGAMSSTTRDLSSVELGVVV
jgi:hypothetical protein